MLRFHHVGFGCCVLLATFLAAMVVTAQGLSEPTLGGLRSGARPLIIPPHHWWRIRIHSV
jgi:hypothetical protein